MCPSLFTNPTSTTISLRLEFNLRRESVLWLFKCLHFSESIPFPHPILYFPFFILHSPHSISHSSFSILHSPFPTLHFPFFILHSLFSIGYLKIEQDFFSISWLPLLFRFCICFNLKKNPQLSLCVFSGKFRGKCKGWGWNVPFNFVSSEACSTVDMSSKNNLLVSKNKKRQQIQSWPI